MLRDREFFVRGTEASNIYIYTGSAHVNINRLGAI